jgi:hypothetical protein
MMVAMVGMVWVEGVGAGGRRVCKPLNGLNEVTPWDAPL